MERVPEAFLVDVRDFLRVLALEPWQQETSIGVDHEDSAFELRTFGVENSLSYLRERPDLEELERSVAEIGALLTAEHSGEADFRSEPWGELRDRARDASFHVPPLDSFSISDTPVNTDAVTLGGEETFLRIEILGTYEIFTHQLFEVRRYCGGRGRRLMPRGLGIGSMRPPLSPSTGRRILCPSVWRSRKPDWMLS